MAIDLSSEYNWEGLWSAGLKPGDYFDKTKPLPEFVAKLSDGSIPTSGTALVPGCGRGYDVELLCKAGFTATGLDVSETAVASAREYLESVSLPGEYRVINGNFFTDSIGSFDLVYDYTFFCAITPGVRQKWGTRMAELVKKGGSLITVMYPMKKAIEEDGPPHGVSIDAYREVLGHAFEPVDGPRQLDDASAHPGRGDGQTWWCRWVRV